MHLREQGPHSQVPPHILIWSPYTEILCFSLWTPPSAQNPTKMPKPVAPSCAPVGRIIREVHLQIDTLDKSCALHRAQPARTPAPILRISTATRCFSYCAKVYRTSSRIKYELPLNTKLQLAPPSKRVTQKCFYPDLVSSGVNRSANYHSLHAGKRTPGKGRKNCSRGDPDFSPGVCHRVCGSW